MKEAHKRNAVRLKADDSDSRKPRRQARENPRSDALHALLAYEKKGGYVQSYLGDASYREEKNRTLFVRLLYGVTERRLSLDYAMSFFVKKGAETLLPHTRNLLRIGLYQLYYLEKIPAFAAVSETVSLAGDRGEAALVNGVLRRAAREAQPLPPREKNAARYLSVCYSFPLPTVKFFLSLFSEEETEALLSAFCKEGGLTIRVNTLRLSRDAYLAKLRDSGIAAEITPYAPYGVRLFSSVDPTRLPGYREGDFFVQDEASQIEGAVLSPKPFFSVLDVSAAPGGKSLSAAMYMENRGRILSADIAAQKLPLIKENADRLGISVIETLCHDAEKPFLLPNGGESFDAVIADLPCSGFGVFGKKPDLRYAKAERLSALPPLQERILKNAAACVKPGGVLLYSTCTLNPDENERQVERFLAANPAFCAEDFAVSALRSENGMLTLYPHRHGCDGFFIAKLRRTAE